MSLWSASSQSAVPQIAWSWAEAILRLLLPLTLSTYAELSLKKASRFVELPTTVGEVAGFSAVMPTLAPEPMPASSTWMRALRLT